MNLDAIRPHAVRGYAVLERLGVLSARGLSLEEARARLLRFGPNSLPGPGRGDTFVRAIIDQVLNFLILLLLGATILALAIGELVEAITIMAIVVLAVLLGAVQNWRAQRAIAALQRMSTPQARVTRERREFSIPAAEVVPGDIVLLESGSAVPADLRLIETHVLRVNEAPLTGESPPVEKDADAVLPESTPLADRTNCAYAGTSVAYGRGRGVVFATGPSTELGAIAELIGRHSEETTPLQLSMSSLSRSLGGAAIAASVLVFTAGMLHGLNTEEVALAAIGLAVAAVPEGLPAIVVIALALGMQRMARRRALIRRLTAVETLGCATTIMTDKTGTLTTGQMTATTVVLGADEGAVTVTGVGYQPVGAFFRDGSSVDPATDEQLALLLTAAALCNDARVEPGETGWRVIGDPTEGALMVLAMKAGLSWERLEEQQPRTDEIPFTSERASMITVHELAGRRIEYAKGAPERIVAACASRRVIGGVRPLSREDSDGVLASAHVMASSGMRVMAFAYRPLPRLDSPVTGDETDLIFVGLVGIDDPPREESREAIRACFAAGVRPLLVTGDHAATAMAIAHRLGLAGLDEIPVTGVDLETMGEAELEAAVRTHSVFARTSAAQKLQIVSALQAAGEVVAVTGDGVNDAPALQRADIGVAMGISGTDVAKESSDMIVTDDNFASIVAAIEEGRRIYDNIRNVVVYLIGGNIGEVMVLFVGVVVGLPLPLLATQILFVNLVTDGPPAIGLAVEAADPIALQRRPRPRNESMLTVPIWSTVVARGAILAAAVLFAFTLSYKVLDDDLATGRTIGFTTLIVAGVLKSFTCRSLYLPVWKLPATANPQLLGAILLSLGALLVVVVAPPLQDAFDTRTLDAGQWTMAIGIALVPLVLIEALKVSPWRLRR